MRLLESGSTPFERLADRIFRTISASFPVCCASDEFYFFPQAVVPGRDWSAWDDLGPESVERMAIRLGEWERALLPALAGRSPEERAEAAEIRRTLEALREQLTEVRQQERQPTFVLTVVTAGLTEALSAGGEAWAARVSTLPGFLERAAGWLREVPDHHREMALAMAADLKRWLASPAVGHPLPGEAGKALDRFGARLEAIEPVGDFRLPEEVLDRVLRVHLDCGEGVEGCLEACAAEYREARAAVEREAAMVLPGVPWREVPARLARTPVRGNVLDLYRREVSALRRHCLEQGLAPAPLADLPLDVAPVPSSLAAIRTAAAYAAVPGHPPAGGTFFVHAEEEGEGTLHPEYRHTCAHETFPGHHLLDGARWSLGRAARRPLERPVFYEGWACLAESLLLESGYHRGPGDRLLVAWRRLKRAVRGTADLELQTGRTNFREAAGLLSEAGFPPSVALGAVRSYALRPGYQVCYTVGLRRFLDLRARSGLDPGSFSRTVLDQGEIGFADIGRSLLGSPGNEPAPTGEEGP